MRCVARCYRVYGGRRGGAGEEWSRREVSFTCSKDSKILATAATLLFAYPERCCSGVLYPAATVWYVAAAATGAKAPWGGPILAAPLIQCLELGGCLPTPSYMTVLSVSTDCNCGNTAWGESLLIDREASALHRTKPVCVYIMCLGIYMCTYSLSGSVGTGWRYFFLNSCPSPLGYIS